MLHRQLHRGLLGARTSSATPRIPRCSDIVSYAGDSSVLGHRQLRRGLLCARISPAMPGTPRCSNIASYARGSSVLGHRPLRWGLLGARTSPTTLGTPRCPNIVSYAGDSSVLGFLVQASPAKLRTSLVVEFCYVSLVCYQAAPCCSDQGADLRQHV